MQDSQKPRRVTPRKFALLTATSLAAATPAMLPILAAGSVGFATAAEASEGGESGEAGVARSEGPSAYLTELGYFEGTYLIIAQLYLTGERDLARAHMEESHHAIYEDIAPRLAEHGAAPFAAQADAFNAAVASGAPDAEVRTAFDALMAAIGEARAAAALPLSEQLVSIKDLLTLAHAEFEGGVDAGRVEVPIEYRDSWGFYETARTRTKALAADPETSQAGARLLEKMAGLETLYPGLDADSVSGDPSPLAAAAGWAEIIALRAK